MAPQVGSERQQGAMTPQNRHRTGFRGPSPDVGKATRFQPGRSGNPAGRPRTKPLTEALRRILSRDEDCDALARAIVRFARKGSVHHFREIADRLEGKVTQPVELAGTVEHVITEAEKLHAIELVQEMRVLEARGDGQWANDPAMNGEYAGEQSDSD